MLRRLLLGGAVCGGLLGTGERESECCGIVGMVMKAPITREQQAKMGRANYRYTLEEFLCEGVELLKNRGYDSAGVFTLSAATQAGRLVKYAEHGLKQAGCINKVVEEVMQETGVATSGIAHTRWATCGEKVDRNSHPHFDEGNQIYLVHNGIITNHASIKNEYLPDVKFTSSTDTEVIVQFLALRRRQGSSMLQALEEFRSKAGEKSQWGLVIIDRTAPDTIYTATNGSPLLIGFSAEEDEILVVSERIAFEKHVNCYFPSYDHEVFELKVTEIPQLKERMRERLFHITEPQKVELRPPAQFSHWYNYEIRQQAEIPFVADFERVKAIEFGDFLTMLACGSSYYAACAGEYFFKRLRCFRKVNIVDPVEMEPSDITENETVVLISQSGETKDLISIVGDCKQRASVKTIGIINVEGSTLARKVDFPIYIKVGREVCVAATKSFFHQVLNVIRFATEVAEQKKSAPLAEIEQIRASLALAPQKVREIIERNEAKCEELAQLLRGRESLYLLGKRESMAIAKEAALKIKELNYIHAEALGACEMKHGPIALIESDRKQETAVILFVLRNETFTVMMNALDQMDSRNAFVVVITDCEEEIEQQHKKEVEKIEKENEKLPEADRRPHPTRKYHFILTIPHLPHASHLLAIIPIQLFVEKMCPLRGGIDPDHPRNLAKSVTV